MMQHRQSLPHGGGAHGGGECGAQHRSITAPGSAAPLLRGGGGGLEAGTTQLLQPRQVGQRPGALRQHGQVARGVAAQIEFESRNFKQYITL